MTKKMFGTDGVRGKVNSYPMLPELVLKLGLAAGTYFRTGKKRHRVVIGKDTRLSGYVFENALTAGLCAAGMDVFLIGPIPTPAIAFLTQNMLADFGVVLSASHNPSQDNGIKFFDSNGWKLPDKVERIIEEMVLDPTWEWDYPEPDDVGRAYKIEDAKGRYIVYLKHSFPRKLTLDGMRIVLDCAHGASYKVAPLVLEELGAEVIKLNVAPNGLNINYQCGALYPAVAAQKVRETRADIGLSLDGDADRLIVVDEKGTVLDGDQIMAICALDLLQKGQLPGGVLVSTVMSNMALEIFMQEHGGRLLRTAVGDRYVAEAMREHGAALGGEQSGHLIFSEHGTTGDGLLAALQLMRIMKERNKPLSELAGLLTPFPQKLINVPIEKKIPFESDAVISAAVTQIEQDLAGRGRVLLRYSGTENLARVMLEGEDEEQVCKLAEHLAATVQSRLR